MSEEQVEDLIELQSTVFLNMAVCHYMLKEFEESLKKASESIILKPTIKAYYRRAQVHAAMTSYKEACVDLVSAIKLDTEDPNDFQTELAKFKRLQKKKEEENK